MAAFQPEEPPPSQHIRSLRDFTKGPKYDTRIPGNHGETVLVLTIIGKDSVINELTLDNLLNLSPTDEGGGNLMNTDGSILMTWHNFITSPFNDLQDYFQETLIALQPGIPPFNKKNIQYELNGIHKEILDNDINNQLTGRDYPSVSVSRGVADLSGTMAAEGGKSRRKSKRKSRRRKTRSKP